MDVIASVPYGNIVGAVVVAGLFAALVARHVLAVVASTREDDPVGDDMRVRQRAQARARGMLPRTSLSRSASKRPASHRRETRRRRGQLARASRKANRR